MSTELPGFAVNAFHADFNLSPIPREAGRNPILRLLFSLSASRSCDDIDANSLARASLPLVDHGCTGFSGSFVGSAFFSGFAAAGFFFGSAFFGAAAGAAAFFLGAGASTFFGSAFFGAGFAAGLAGAAGAFFGSAFFGAGFAAGLAGAGFLAASTIASSILANFISGLST